jgi:protein kinase A
LVGSNGYLKIIDFGNSRQTTARCFTVCGTMDYLAPEVWLRKGHSLPVDWWAFGVFLYELIEGSTPFEFNDTNRETMLRRVLKAEITFTSLFDDEPETCDLVRKLCTVKENKRLGCTRDGIKSVKDHPFFNGISWGDVATQNMVAPALPKIDLEFDGSALVVTQKSGTGERSMHDRLMDDTAHYKGVGYVAEDVFWVDSF